MNLSEKITSKPRQIACCGFVFLMLMLFGCSSPKTPVSHAPTVFYAPTVLQISNPKALSDAELRKISSCEYWDVCRFQKYEEVEPFGPTYLYKDRFKFKPQKICRFETCDRLEAFYHKALN